jgi:ribosomal protein L37AE/L43A
MPNLLDEFEFDREDRIVRIAIDRSAPSSPRKGVANGQSGIKEVKLHKSLVTTCTYCQRPIEANDKVYECEVCGVRLHKRCYETNEACTNPACSTRHTQGNHIGI